MNESLFRRAIAKLVRPHEVVVPTDPLADTLSAFKLVLHREIHPDAALFHDVPLDSIDLVEVTITLDEVYGERDWQPLFDAAGAKFALNQQPALTARMIAEWLWTTHSRSLDA